jgi:hypothetical protein
LSILDILDFESFCSLLVKISFTSTFFGLNSHLIQTLC